MLPHEMNYTRYLKFSDYLIDIYREKSAQNPSFSVRSFSKFLGYKTPTLINDVIRKKRKPTIEIALKLSKKLLYSKHQTDYLVKICEYERAKNAQERELITAELRKLLSQKKWEVLDIHEHQPLWQPHVLFIYNMFALKGFKPELNYLNKRLLFTITQEQLNESLDTLLRLGLIQMDKSGNYKLTHEQAVITAGGPKSTQASVDRFHRALMTAAQEALEKAPLERRDVRSLILPIRKKDLQLIINEMIKALQKAAVYSVDLGADELYVLSTQLVPISSSGSTE